MDPFLNNFKQNRKETIGFLQQKFMYSRLTKQDLEESVSDALVKMLIDADRPVPRLTATAQTLKYLAHCAAIDMYRKQRKWHLVELDYTTSDAIDASLEEKDLLEKVIEVVKDLPNRTKCLLEERFDAKHFSEDASIEEMQSFKSRIRPNNIAQALDFPTDGAMRQESCRGLKMIRSRL